MSRILLGRLSAARRPATIPTFQRRFFHNAEKYDALVIGAYTNAEEISLSATQSISSGTQKVVLEQLAASAFKKQGDVRTLYNVGGVKQVAVVSLGKKGETTGEAERLESARMASALGIQALRKQGVKNVGVDVSVSAHGAAEGAVLAQFAFDKLKNEKSRADAIQVTPFSESAEESKLDWESGQIYGASQNLARMLMTSPGNLMTPKLFSEEVAYLLAGLENVEVIVHDEEWAQRQKMNSFLAVAKGSDEAPRFLEIHYRGATEDQAPHGFVGKGVTFDSGGISLKPSNNMALMKGDMGGAATVAGALYGISKLQLPVNIVATIPLCENMPSSKATKPGDVVRAMNGKSIEVMDTDAEGRLILADALYYLSSKFSPESIIDLATLTGAMDVALGNVYAGVFTNSDGLWSRLNEAGILTSDPFWRMPLHEGYLKEMKESDVADLNNLGKGRSGGAASAAAFLSEFVAGLDPEEGYKVQHPAWAHIDIAGVMDSASTHGYHIKGMSGRPTRSLIEYARGITTKQQ
ncbi:cytosol aminopeptidase family, catalytic domain-containing protein [Zychaea mexicana]|uniref:cytosol aminopeptidase family, catalytic domain-containing protein n=1 Tax=Zychaea mexicana TaxID=64656 RepID=UPI0022FED041|nr:cytosol aminopeptidase family, catalytic domain-containing protein [Zychaea mexicana]KAI9484898.1 cytosol aminopeptidase family, catalytic domain-containing protein [Zychaea mexicana]